MKNTQFVKTALIVVVCSAIAALALADVGGGGGGNPSFCSCVACGATCQFVWGTPRCVGTNNPYDPCYFCMYGCMNAGISCCTGPPTW